MGFLSNFFSVVPLLFLAEQVPRCVWGYKLELSDFLAGTCRLVLDVWYLLKIRPIV